MAIAALITLMVYEYAVTCIIGRHDNALNSACAVNRAAGTAAVVRWCAMRRTAISPAKRAEMRGDYLWI